MKRIIKKNIESKLDKSVSKESKLDKSVSKESKLDKSVSKESKLDKSESKEIRSEEHKKYLKNLLDRIDSLNDMYEYIEIYKIIKKNNIKYTVNKNGIFLNMMKLDKKTLNEIEQFLEYLNNIKS